MMLWFEVKFLKCIAMRYTRHLHADKYVFNLQLSVDSIYVRICTLTQSSENEQEMRNMLIASIK